MEVQSGAEARRLHIVYFLSRKGLTDHPHLLGVHHHPDNDGVRLHDIKRWLGESRGRQMPESYAWSYKRRYKTGYIWQDLLDDDLVTPVSDNEFVLKGSEIFPKDQSSSETSTESSSKIEESHSSTQEPGKTISSKLTVPNNNKKPGGNGLSTSSDKPRPMMSFRHFVTCGGVDTKDSSVVKTHENLVSRRSIQYQRSKSESRKGKGQTQKLLKGPNCAQCGKPFKPEKLLAHMKSCKGMKTLAPSHASSCAAENKSHISSRNRGSHFLSAFPN